ncbi:PREDICTED: ileal sodium/bile acid cotransporter-like [Priapulus caudatus]|uniref:Ileal sodium/bile acid cotransporter-like n=1 Tax=Priapulus caudatus TaxID=37621 RepID=A0ABM1EE01_PRICU|nr:PREDICTED: ileal sodium/bile acid cotransporter-like [Priapulus caudatus]
MEFRDLLSELYHDMIPISGLERIDAMRMSVMDESLAALATWQYCRQYSKCVFLAPDTLDSFDFSSCADQILNCPFKRWHKLPQTYCSEVSSSFAYVPPGGDTLSPDIQVSWFSGNTWKPWMLAACGSERKNGIPRPLPKGQKSLSVLGDCFVATLEKMALEEEVTRMISSPKAIGMLVIATTPGGAFSNMFSYWSDGDVPLSVCMTGVSTLAAMGMMPLNLLIYGRFWSSAGFSIPYSTMALGMLSLIIPVVVGMLIKRFLPKLAPYVTKFGSLMTGPVVFIFVVLQILIYKDLFNVSWQVYFGAAFGPVMGLSFGFIVGAIARLPWAQCRTVALETGCQNVPLAITLILVSFPQDFVNNAIFVPIVYALCSCVFSLAVVGGWLAYKRWVVSKTAHAQPGKVTQGDYTLTDVSEKQQNVDNGV